MTLTLVPTLDRTPLVEARDPLALDGTECTPLLEPEASTVLESGFMATQVELASPLLLLAHDLAERLSRPVLREALTSIAVTGVLHATWVHPSMAASVIRTAASVAGLLAPMAVAGTTRVARSSPEKRQGNTTRAVLAVTELASWLDCTEEEVAELAGFSRRNLSNWRGGASAYPKTVRGLFEIHGLVGALVHHLGKVGALVWLAQADEENCARRELLRTSAGRSKVQNSAQSLLFQKAQILTFEPEYEQHEETSRIRRSAGGHEVFVRPPVRRRTPPE
ncbi:hypothetical protein [Actinokineospora xionganensis]|uniref:Uncharacterized protein n=1 Tax=Actinokineospora xionganensis TaxID=2684470 RepID=A0ABR7LD90_9PSEU|nr:hypothetical protein [Actinokineospora xionganensis]MBC6450685.1 hypothetical protein [Actinokineospora xionganensis]